MCLIAIQSLFFDFIQHDHMNQGSRISCIMYMATFIWDYILDFGTKFSLKLSAQLHLLCFNKIYIASKKTFQAV
jgi:hypothetical protein